MAVLMAGVELVAGIELVELEVVLLLLDIQMVVFPILRVFGKKKEPTSTSTIKNLDCLHTLIGIVLPFSFFGRFFTDEVWDLLVEETDMQILIVV